MDIILKNPTVTIDGEPVKLAVDPIFGCPVVWIELGEIMTWFWLSFGEHGKNLGACIVRGSDLRSAITRSHALGINPGGEVLSIGPIEDVRARAMMLPEHLEVLLSKQQVADTYGLAPVEEPTFYQHRPPRIPLE